MKMIVATSLSTLVLTCTVATAHHSKEASYELDTISEIEGELTRVLWRNPHIRFWIETDANGNGVFPIINAAKATSGGIEVDGRFIVNDNLTLGFSGAVLDAEFDSFPGAGCTRTDAFFGLNGCGPPGATQDLAEEPLLYSPDWTLAFDGTYTRPVGNNLRLTFNADVVFADCYECNGRATPLLDDSGYELLNLRIAIGSMDRKWEISAYGRNVTDTQQRRQLGCAFYGGCNSIRALSTRGANYGVQYRYSLGQ